MTSMDTDALKLARRLKANGIRQRLAWGAVELSVTDLERSIKFWSGALGFIPRTEPGTGVALGTPERTLLILHPGARRPAMNGVTGLYHAAFAVPSQEEFSRLLCRFMRLGLRISPVDHTISKAIYLNDPDGHGIEIVLETPERLARFDEASGGLGMIDSEGQFRGGRDPLDLGAELAAAATTDPAGPLASGTVVSHIHLHVPEIEPALNWFEGLGFARNLLLSSIGMADMGAGDAFPHRLAFNIWAGRGAPPAPDHSARLLRYHLTTSDSALFEQAGRFLRPDGHGNLSGLDPAGALLTFAFAPASQTGRNAA
jgi:catechol 2,3-dioxygenase